MAERIALPPLPPLVHNLEISCREDFNKTKGHNSANRLLPVLTRIIVNLLVTTQKYTNTFTETGKTSMSVSGIVTTQRQRSETAKLAMNTFLHRYRRIKM